MGIEKEVQLLISHSSAKSTCAKSPLITASPGRDPSFTAGLSFANSGTTCAIGLRRNVIVSALPVRFTFLISAMQMCLELGDQHLFHDSQVYLTILTWSILGMPVLSPTDVGIRPPSPAAAYLKKILD